MPDKKAENILTEGSIAASLIRFSVPLILSGMLQQLFNWVDAFIVGNVAGERALAGIGATTVLVNLFVTVIIGFTSGLSVLTAQRYGMGRRDDIRDILQLFSLLLGTLFICLSAAGMLFTRNILTVMDTPRSILDVSVCYLRPLLVGVPFLAVYNTYSSVMRGIGNSKTAFFAVLLSSFMNVLLDLLFVVTLRLGASGAAWATAISQASMTVFVVIYALKRYPFLRNSSISYPSFQREASQGSRFGIPPAIQSAVSSAGSILLQRFMNGFGEKTVAAVSTAYRIDLLILLPVTNFGSAVSTMVAQNVGAGNYERAKKVLRTGSVMIGFTSVCLTCVVLLSAETLIAMFGLSPESIVFGRDFFHAIAMFYLVFGLSMAFRGYLEGCGDLVFSGSAAIAALILRIICSYAFVSLCGRMIIAYAEAFSWLFMLCMYAARSMTLQRKLQNK